MPRENLSVKAKTVVIIFVSLAVLAIVLALLLPGFPGNLPPYSRIHSGMTATQVRADLGVPQNIRTNTDGTLAFIYSVWSGGKFYIGFDTNGIVDRYQTFPND